MKDAVKTFYINGDQSVTLAETSVFKIRKLIITNVTDTADDFGIAVKGTGICDRAVEDASAANYVDAPLKENGVSVAATGFYELKPSVSKTLTFGVPAFSTIEVDLGGIQLHYVHSGTGSLNILAIAY